MRVIFILSLICFFVCIDGAPTFHLIRKHMEAKMLGNGLYGSSSKTSPTIIIQNSPQNVQTVSQSKNLDPHDYFNVGRRQPALSIVGPVPHPLAGYNHHISSAKSYSMSSSSSSSSANTVIRNGGNPYGHY
uniref:Uncharacterized protein n=1 Tax=Glossina brevipalpis TaxID=37001 RepID=A0A1A9WU13_9MUSC